VTNKHCLFSGSRNFIRSVKNRKKSGEDTENDPDVLVAGINKLRRQGQERSTEVSEISDGFKTPDDTESITSDIFGAPEFVKEGEDSFADRFSSRSSGTSSAVPRPTRKSYTKDLSEDRSARYTSSRPVARRSVSRELFDLKYGTGKTSPSFFSTINEPDNSSYLSAAVRKTSKPSREGSASRELLSDTEIGTSSGYSSSLRTDNPRSLSVSRGPLSGRPDSLNRPPISSTLPSRPSLSSGGRSNTQSELKRASPLSPLSPKTSSSRYSSGDEDGLSYGGSLRDRKRQDWRRISVPERGKDYSSLPRKYDRLTSYPNI